MLGDLKRRDYRRMSGQAGLSDKSSEYESKILRNLFVNTIIPLVLLEVSTAGTGFVDSLAVSQFLGSKEMAVAGLASPYFSITGVVAGLLVTGMQTLSAKAYGSGDSKRAEGYFSLALVVGGVLSVGLMLAFLFGGDAIGRALGAVGESADLLPELKKYLWGLGIGTPGIVLFTLLLPIAQMNGGKGFVRVSVVAGLIVDAVLDVLAGVSGWGMFGMGLATSVAGWSQFVFLLPYVVGPTSTIHFSLADIAWKELSGMVLMGLPKAIRRVANMLRPIFLNRLVLALGGSAAMSAMSIRNSLDGIGDVVGSGIAAALMLLVGVLYGEENRDGIMQIGRLTIRYTFLAVGAVAALLFAGAPWLANIYASDSAEVVVIATFAIKCMAVNLVLNAFIEEYINQLQATEQTVKTHLVNIASRFVCVVTCAFVLGSLFGIKGVFLAFPVASLLLIAFVVIATMIHKRSIAITPMDILGLPDDFGVAPEDTLCYNITSEDPRYPIETQDIYAFCEDHGFDRRKAFRFALCLEEMVTNIIEHGFTKDDKQHSIDVRLVAKGDELILRVRDDCVRFNVKEKGENWKERPDDVVKNIGIRMTMAMAKDLKYVNTLGTNTLLITV